MMEYLVLGGILILFVVLLAAGTIAYVYIKVFKSATKEEEIDYSTFDRKDTLDYVAFDDVITDSQGNGILVTNNGTRFVAALTTIGFDYFSASYEERKSTMLGVVELFNTLEGNLQFRQSTKKVDIDDTIEIYEDKVKEKEALRQEKILDYRELEEQSHVVNEDDYNNIFVPKFNSLEKEIQNISWRIDVLESEINYMHQISGDSVDPERELIYIFEWNYIQGQYSANLEKEEKYAIAIKEIENLGNNFINALEKCNVMAERMNSEELIECNRRHYNPISSERYRIRDVLGTAFDEICVTSDSFKEIDSLIQEENEQKEIMELVNQMEQKEYNTKKEVTTNMREDILGKEIKEELDDVLNEEDEEEFEIGEI